MSIQLAIVGGGIAGLWTLRRAIALGYNAILLEKDGIGGGQTLASQGILHSGVKYGLDGTPRHIAELLKSQPPRWQDCLAGRGEIDLSQVVANAREQHLWASDSWLEQIAAAAGARAMQSQVRALARPAWPQALRDGGHTGSVYALAETVLDVKSLCQALAEPVRGRIFQAAVDSLDLAADGTVRAVLAQGQRIEAEVFLFAAATGNEGFAEALDFGKQATQRRPLRQVLVRGKLPPLFGHAVSASPKPIVTVTSHALGDDTVWYLGGGVAEEGAELGEEQAISHARRTLQGIFPQFDWPAMAWATWLVDRAEPSAASRLPDGPALLQRGNAALCWPTKLVYAPALADRALEFFQQLAQPAGRNDVTVDLPLAGLGAYPWERIAWRRPTE